MRWWTRRRRPVTGCRRSSPGTGGTRTRSRCRIRTPACGSPGRRRPRWRCSPPWGAPDTAGRRLPAVGEDAEDRLYGGPGGLPAVGEGGGFEGVPGEGRAGEVVVLDAEFVGDGRGEGVGVPGPHVPGVGA